MYKSSNFNHSDLTFFALYFMLSSDYRKTLYLVPKDSSDEHALLGEHPVESGREDVSTVEVRRGEAPMEPSSSGAQNCEKLFQA